MGDLIEITTRDNYELNCYMISSGALKFYVKGQGRAVIRLASKPWEKYKIMTITIGNIFSCININKRVETLNIISKHTYKPFWISWYGNEIRIGTGDNPKPFLEQKLLHTINCISFSSLGHYTMHWKFRLPPKIKEPVYRKISHGELKWVKMEGNCLPEDALIGGYENEVLYIMRAMHEDALTPGKFVPSKAAGYIAWGNEAHEKTDMEILCGYDGIWVPTEGDRIPLGTLFGGFTEDDEIMFVGRALHNKMVIPGNIVPKHKILCGYDGIWISTEKDKIPSGALVGGYTEYGETMFVGRTVHNKSVIPGKIAPLHKVSYIPYNGKEIFNTKYEILVTLNISNES